jgi:hypothetical protein
MRRDHSEIYKNLKGLFAKRQGIWIFSDFISNRKSCALGDCADKRRDGASSMHDARALEVTGAHRRWPGRVRKARQSQ